MAYFKEKKKYQKVLMVAKRCKNFSLIQGNLHIMCVPGGCLPSIQQADTRLGRWMVRVTPVWENEKITGLKLCLNSDLLEDNGESNDLVYTKADIEWIQNQLLDLYAIANVEMPELQLVG